MNKKKYNSPNISISKVYTKTGDRGHTQLVGGKKISKSDLRICSYGEIDELNSYVGGCRQMIIDSKVENDDLQRRDNNEDPFGKNKKMKIFLKTK